MTTFQLEHFSAFKDFALLDTGKGYRLEQWGDYRLARPDPQITWDRHLPDDEWQRADAIFESIGEGGGWKTRGHLPGAWVIQFTIPGTKDDILLNARLTPFKHTGIFAEQAANWEWMAKKLQGKKNRKILNLFGYTGAASVFLTKLGHHVTHVDASKPAIGFAKENQELSSLSPDSIRWILDDAVKFVLRERRRGQFYDGIIMDPPAFGHSPDGRTWKLNQDLPFLLENAVEILTPDADFLLINGYATNSSALSLYNLLEDCLKGKRKGTIEFGELCLQQKDKRLISTGIFTRWCQ